MHLTFLLDMADALGGPATLLDLISTTTELITACYDYRRALKDHALKDLLILMEELASFRQTLENLMRVFDSQDERRHTLLANVSLVNGTHGLLHFCNQEINDLLKRLKPKTGDRSFREDSRLLRNIRWPLTLKKTQWAIESIKAHQHTLALAITASQKYAKYTIAL